MHSDESSEMEYWKAPLDGMGEPVQISSGSTVIMFEREPSSDGKMIAYTDYDNKLWLLNVQNKTTMVIDTAVHERGMGEMSWSPDSKWMAYMHQGVNQTSRIKLHNVRTWT
jgi:tricorn protease